jgi:hypothetical protein
MTPVNGGRFCSLCSKKVHDFANMTTAEIQDMLKVSAGNKLCVRVQVSAPSKRTRLIKFLAAVFVVFGLGLFQSCSRPPGILVMGEMQPVIGDTIPTSDTVPVEHKLGEIEAPPHGA